MLRGSTHRFHKAINRGANAILPSVIYFVAFGECVFAHFAIAQTTESGHSFIESRSLIFRQIIPDFRGFLPDAVDSVTKLSSEFVGATFNPRSKAAHKTKEISPSISFGIFQRVFSRCAISQSG